MQVRMKIQMWEMVWPTEKFHETSVHSECSNDLTHVSEEVSTKKSSKVLLALIHDLEAKYEPISYDNVQWNFPVQVIDKGSYILKESTPEESVMFPVNDKDWHFFSFHCISSLRNNYKKRNEINFGDFTLHSRTVSSLSPVVYPHS
jgi:hypothetical protein